MPYSMLRRHSLFMDVTPKFQENAPTETLSHIHPDRTMKLNYGWLERGTIEKNNAVQ